MLKRTKHSEPFQAVQTSQLRYYTYSDLKAEPSTLMLKYFDIGFYYADWGSIDVYIKLPAGTIPEALLGFSSDGLHVHQSDEWQLLIFSIEEYGEYFDDEQADDFFQHLAGLRSELIQGNGVLCTLCGSKRLIVMTSLRKYR